MSLIFLHLLNLSITASWFILAVVILRLLLKKAPKWISCALWALVGIRLICPFSFESALSLIPSSEIVPYDIELSANPAIESGIPTVNLVINPLIAGSFTPDPRASANPLQIVLPIVSVIWMAGMIALLMYALISYSRLKRNVGSSIVLRDNILACDDVKSPFILGIFRPMIYVPSSMAGETLDCVIIHEAAHIKRHDHWWKPLGYLLLTIYWFNPLCWVAYILLCRDIELACDEKVIRDMDRNSKAIYSQALLNANFPRKKIVACPLAFGEVGVKERVKSVLNYKKPAFWVIFVAIVACIVVAICFMTNPKKPQKTEITAKNTVIEFFDAFKEADHEAMKQYCTEPFVKKYFHDGDIWGMRAASMENFSEEAVDEYNEIFMVDVKMETVPESALYPEDETSFYIHLIYSSGEWLIDGINTDGFFEAESEAEENQNDESLNNTEKQEVILYGEELAEYLQALPEDADSLSEYGCFVMSNNGIIYGAEHMSDFLDHYSAGKMAAITLGQYTTEGDLILYYVAFDGSQVIVTHDARRDKFADPNYLYDTGNYKYFSLFEWMGDDGTIYEEIVAYDDPDFTQEKMWQILASSEFIPGEKKQFAWLGSFMNGTDIDFVELAEKSSPCSPSDIISVNRIDLQLMDGEEYSITDPKVLTKIEKMLGEAIEIKEAGCPFHTPIYLTKKDGSIGVIYPATDSCAVFFSDGKYYDYSEGDNREFWSLLGLETDLGDVYRK